LKTGNILILKERNYNENLIVKVLRYIYKIVLIKRSILITINGNKKDRKVIVRLAIAKGCL
jgi:20S proteasome alpha/beta subunit